MWLTASYASMSAGMPSCFSLGEGQIFVARRNPELREKTSPDIYLERGAALETPIGGWQLQPANSTAGNGQEFAGLRSSTVTIPTRKSGSQETRRWRGMDSNPRSPVRTSQEKARWILSHRRIADRKST